MTSALPERLAFLEGAAPRSRSLGALKLPQAFEIRRARFPILEGLGHRYIVGQSFEVGVGHEKSPLVEVDVELLKAGLSCQGFDCLDHALRPPRPPPLSHRPGPAPGA